MGSNISTAVDVSIKNRSDVSMIVYDAQTIARVTDDVDEALRKREAEVCRQGVTIPAHQKITLRRNTGSSLRFWTSNGQMAFAEFNGLRSGSSSDSDNNNDDGATNNFDPKAPGVKCPNGHELVSSDQDNGWGCDGRHLPGGCRRGVTGFFQTTGLARFQCELCDFDLCDMCLDAQQIAESSRRRPRLTLSPQYLKTRISRARKTLAAEIFVHEFTSEWTICSFEGRLLREDRDGPYRPFYGPFDHSYTSRMRYEISDSDSDSSPHAPNGPNGPQRRVLKNSHRLRWLQVKFTNLSSHDAEIFTYDWFGQRMHSENLRAGHNTIIRTHANKPWTFLDEEGERMMLSWCWWEKEMEEEEEQVLHEASSTVFFAPTASCHDYLQVDARINTPTLKALTIRLLRRMRQRNGLEWPRNRIPASFIEELERVEDRERFHTLEGMQEGYGRGLLVD